MESVDVLIIGLGPAALSAAIYCSRAKLSTLAIGKKEDSQLWKAHTIENFFGFPKGIDGKQLLENGLLQAKKFGSKIVEENVIKVLKKDNLFEVKTASKVFSAKALIFASGAKFEKSGIKNEEKFLGKGLSTCVACDGFAVNGKKVFVIGSADFAAKEALELLPYSKDISIFTNGLKESISPELKKKLKENKIQLVDEKCAEFFGDNFLKSVKLANGKIIPVEHVFLAFGNASTSDLALPLGVEIEADSIKVNEWQETSIEGVFAAGNCCSKKMQVGIAVSQGIMASFSVNDFLSK